MNSRTDMRHGRRKVGAALILAALVAGCTQQPAAQKTPAPVRVDTVKVEDYAPVVQITGEIRPRTQSQLSFRTSGRITARRSD